MSTNNVNISLFVHELECWLNFNKLSEFRAFVRNYAKISRTAEKPGAINKVMSCKWHDYASYYKGYTICIIKTFDENKYWTDMRKRRDAELDRLMEASA